MMISEEQVRRAVEYLRNSDGYTGAPLASADASTSELVERVVESLGKLPDVRDDRIAHARLLVGVSLPSSAELASKLIGRVVSDSVR